MTRSSESGKSGEKRLEEAKKWQAETERSLAVLKAKEAHKLIEEIEKGRKRSAIFSVCDRLLRHAALTNGYARILLDRKSKHENYEIESPDRIYIEDLMRTYESIRYDFQKNMEMRDEEIEKLFPKLSPDFTEFMATFNKLQSAVDQMIDMVIYCKRIWK